MISINTNLSNDKIVEILELLVQSSWRYKTIKLYSLCNMRKYEGKIFDVYIEIA